MNMEIIKKEPAVKNESAPGNFEEFLGQVSLLEQSISDLVYEKRTLEDAAFIAMVGDRTGQTKDILENNYLSKKVHLEAEEYPYSEDQIKKLVSTSKKLEELADSVEREEGFYFDSFNHLSNFCDSDLGKSAIKDPQLEKMRDELKRETLKVLYNKKIFQEVLRALAEVKNLGLTTLPDIKHDSDYYSSDNAFNIGNLRRKMIALRFYLDLFKKVFTKETTVKSSD